MLGFWRFYGPRGQVNLFVDQFLPEMAIDEFDAMPRIRDSQTGPPDEILHGCRSMTGEIALRQFRQSLVASQWFCRRYSFVKKRVSELLAQARATAHNAIQFRANENMRHAHGIVCR